LALEIKKSESGELTITLTGGLYMSPSRPWRRSRHERVLAGVFSGLAESWHMDVNLLRAAWVLFTLFISKWWGVTFYVLAIFLLPVSDEGAAFVEGSACNQGEGLRSRRIHRWLGIFIILFGGYLLATQLIPDLVRDIQRELQRIVLPLTVIGFGLWMLLRSTDDKED
jgi:phage shock protein PspC (stress-responsive transcriptional regulator)